MLDYGTASVDGQYNSTSHSWNWYHIIISGEVTIAGVTVGVDVIRLDVDNIPTLFINTTAEYGTIGVNPVVLDVELLYYWLNDCSHPKFTGQGSLILDFNESIALNATVNATYDQCDVKWKFAGEVKDLTWKMDHDLELQDLVVELESVSVGNTSILSGFVLGEAHLYGLEAEAQVFFNNQVGLEEISANISFTYKMVDFNASIVYNRYSFSPLIKYF